MMWTMCMMQRIALAFLICFFFSPGISQAGESSATVPKPMGSLMEKKGNDWKIKLNTLYAYDDNVVHTPTDNALRPSTLTGRGDSVFGASGTGTYFLHPTEKVKLRLEYDIDSSWHTSLNEYDLMSQIFSVIPTYKITPLMNIQFQYSYIYNIVNGSSFSGIHYLSPSFNHMSQTFGFTRIYYTLKLTNNLQFVSRDNVQNTAGISHYFFFLKNKGRLNLAYNFTHDNTRGQAFERRLHGFKAALKSPLIYGINFDASTNISIRDYKSRLADDGVNARRDVYQLFSVGLSKVLTREVGWLERLTMYVDYRHTLNSTNLNVHEYKTNRTRMGLRGLF